MEEIRDDTIGGFNAFLAAQQAVAEEATLTLVQFDSQDPYEVVHRFRALATVPPLTRETYVPRASTPLLDALGRGINDLEAGLAEMPAAQRPERVVMVIVTDGQENASREFTRDQVVKMIAAKQAQGWQFVFLSADLDAVQDAVASGVRVTQAMAFRKDAAGTRDAFASASANLASYRRKEKGDVSFEDEDRNKQK